MSSIVSLSPGQLLVTHSGNAFLRLGLIVEGPGGLHGLTARHILDQEEDTRIYDAATVQFVGHRLPLTRRHHSAGEPREFFETIGAFAIQHDAATVNFADPLVVGMMIGNPMRSIGRSVYKVGQNGSRTPATVVGYGGTVEIARSGSNELYREVLEITFGKGPDDPVADGEAGSLILDERGAAIGLMIAGNRQACYVAPLLPFMHRNSFSVVSRVATPASHHNADVEEELSVGFRRALAGAGKIRSALSGTSDPEKEEIPKKLLDLVEVA